MREPMVIGYDLINEPWGVPLDEYDSLYKAIRNRDPNHVIFMETWGVDRMDTTIHHWSNVACSLHFYPSGDSASQITAIQHFKDEIGAFRKTAVEKGIAFPIHVGEFRFADDEKVYEAGLKSFTELGLSWTFWTYKTTDKGGWGLYNRINDPPKPDVPDLYADSAAQITAYWAQWRTPKAPTMNPLTCGWLGMPMFTDIKITIPADGVLNIREQDLLRNARSCFSDRQLTIVQVPHQTKNGTLTRTKEGWTYRSHALPPTLDQFSCRCCFTDRDYVISPRAAKVMLQPRRSSERNPQ